MVHTSSLQILPLPSVTEGNRHGITITNAPSAVTLEFRNGADPTWRPFPGFDGTLSEVIFGLFFATSPNFRLNFAAVPEEPYYVSVIQEAVSKY